MQERITLSIGFGEILNQPKVLRFSDDKAVNISCIGEFRGIFEKNRKENDG